MMAQERADQAREREIEQLVGEIGMERAEAERVLEDDDLWLVYPEVRYGFEGEEAVRQWEGACEFASALCEGFAAQGPPVIDEATQQLLWDMRRRAEEALRRARERA